jgi:hypothetical protein
MAEIKLFLLSSIENDLNINQFFPSDYNDQNTISELLNVSRHFKKCGDGCLQTKDFKYYYKTFIPLVKNEQNLFLLFYCTNSYSEKNIDRLCEDLFQILDDEPIEELELKETAKNAINDVFLNYKNLKNDINQNLLGNEIKLKKKLSLNDSISEEKADSSQSKIFTGNNRRGDPRFYSYIIHKQLLSSNDSDDVFSDSNIFKTCSFEDSVAVNKNYKDNTTNENFEKWKKVKKNYLIFSILLSIVTYFFLPLLLRYIFN